MELPTARGIEEASASFPQKLIQPTPLVRSEFYSELFDADIYLKLENLMPRVHAYKIRGALRKLMMSHNPALAVCASAGNHSQGFAAACNYLGIPGKVFMAKTASPQKLARTKMLGNGQVEIIVEGEVFDDAKQAALDYAETQGATFVHPFDDLHVIEGQGTVAYEIHRQMQTEGKNVDHVLVPVGGGGLLAGVATYFGERSPGTVIHGIEPDTSAAMHASVREGKVLTLDSVSSFVDGVAVRRVGDLPFAVVEKYKPVLGTIPENAVCETMLDFYQRKSMLVEPAGALSVAALESVRDEIRGMTVACIVSGGNVDMERWPDIQNRAEHHRGLRKTLLVELPQAPGPLHRLTEILARFGVSIGFIHYDRRDRTGAEQGLVDLELEALSADAMKKALAEAQTLHYKITEKPFLRK